MRKAGGREGQVEVMDLYLACYYVLRGCELAGVTCIPTGKDYRCEIVLRGDEDLVNAIQGEYFSHTATVNLFAFRDAYNQVSSGTFSDPRSAGFSDPPPVPGI